MLEIWFKGLSSWKAVCVCLWGRTNYKTITASEMYVSKWLLHQSVKCLLLKEQVKYESLKRLDHWDIIKNVFIEPGCKATGVYNLPGILTGIHPHKERKASLKMKSKTSRTR